MNTPKQRITVEKKNLKGKENGRPYLLLMPNELYLSSVIESNILKAVVEMAASRNWRASEADVKNNKYIIGRGRGEQIKSTLERWDDNNLFIYDCIIMLCEELYN